MSAVSQLDSDFAFVGAAEPEALVAAAGDPLGPLADLPARGTPPAHGSGMASTRSGVHTA